MVTKSESENNSIRSVYCKKYNQQLPGLIKPPFRGDLGKLVYDNTSEKAWLEWKEMQIKVLNEYRLDMSDKVQYDQLIDTMLSFLGLSGDKNIPEVGDVARGKGN